MPEPLGISLALKCANLFIKFLGLYMAVPKTYLLYAQESFLESLWGARDWITESRLAAIIAIITLYPAF